MAHPERITLAKLPLLLTPLTYIPAGKDARIAKLKSYHSKSILYFSWRLCVFAREIIVFMGGHYLWPALLRLPLFLFAGRFPGLPRPSPGRGRRLIFTGGCSVAI